MDSKRKGLFSYFEQDNRLPMSNSGQKKKFRFKFPWKKNIHSDRDSSEQLDVFIKEVIEKAKEEYLRECETDAKYRNLDLPVTGNDDALITDDENEEDSSNTKINFCQGEQQNIEENNESVDSRVISEQQDMEVSHHGVQENKPLLNQTEPEVTSASNNGSVRKQFTKFLGCEWCGCCNAKYEVT